MLNQVRKLKFASRHVPARAEVPSACEFLENGLRRHVRAYNLKFGFR